MQSSKGNLVDLLERLPRLLRADQHSPVDPALIGAIDQMCPDEHLANDLTPQERVRLGNYFFFKGQPVQALRCWWSSVRDGDKATRAVASNNAAVAHFGFCPGMLAFAILNQEVTQGE